MNGNCQRCNQQPATVHLTEILDDQEKRERHLCEQCAQEENGPLGLMGMLSSAFTPEVAKDDPSGLRCAECGLGYMEFRARGRLGCPRCYETFRTSLEPLLEKIHGGTQHVGKAPDESSAVDRSRERKLVELRRNLQASVREERYEDAAKLRDELTRFESEPADDADATGPDEGAASTDDADAEEDAGAADDEGSTLEDGEADVEDR